MIHPSSKLAPDVKVWQYASIGANTEIGEGSVVGSCVWIGKNCKIGKNCRFQHGAFIPNGTVIEDDVFIGPNCTLTDDKYPRSGNKDYLALPPKICRGASLGAGCVILPGVIIEAGAMVGAGAVVTNDVTYGDLAVGVPARSKLHS